MRNFIYALIGTLILSTPVFAVEKNAASQKADTQTTANAAKKSTKKAPRTWPENVTPSKVYDVVIELNAYADALLKHNKIESTEKVPTIKEKIFPMVVFQLHIATIELLHDYELDIGMRPIPIVTSSPIKYYPADVKFMSDLILQRLQKIAKHYGIKHIPKHKKHYGEATPTAVFQSMLEFYVKLAALDGVKSISPNEVYSQMYRLNQEMKDIVLNKTATLKSPREKRLLASSTYGTSAYSGKPLGKADPQSTPSDVFKLCLKIRTLMQPFLKKNNAISLPIPKFDPDKKYKPIDVFIQTQIIVAQLGEWKRATKVSSSTPVTVQVINKKPADVAQEAMSVIYMLERMQQVLGSK